MKKDIRQHLRNLELQNEQVYKNIPFPLLSCDYGTIHCGFAYSPDGVCILPLGVFPTQDLHKTITQYLQKYTPKQLIIGIPLNKDNSENELCAEIRRVFSPYSSLIETHYVNERFSSKGTLISGSQKKRIDDLAAARILEFYFDQQEKN